MGEISDSILEAAYPAENITIIRNIKHADEFFITKISFVIPTINVTVPVKLFGKISMTRSPGKVTVTAGIIPKLDVPSPIVPPPFNILNNRVINVDTTRCGDEIPPGGTTMMTKTSNVGGATNQPIGQSSPLSGGDIAAIIMSIVAFVAIVVAVTLYWKRHIIFKRYALENDKGNSNVAI
ncbi:uncharacterized protein TRIADDRAFT_52336 [Trichoplax adhaerens]|uniref:Uncharacterized protein n=1 Tax=Trichoplax adhaerens TaxID=10228 RepID=B3RI04_TRIAD|nr:predicted protein [Trichoplax adhaerens]EDV29681.1 predicted protein [Trichoplax adhaerens]|eukprot:XP_002108883.1 predicted protein [Trichoplax adhaerens]